MSESTSTTTSTSTTKITKQRLAYMNQFNRQNYDRVGLVIPKGQKVKLQAVAKDQGMSLNELYATAMQEWLKINGIELPGES